MSSLGDLLLTHLKPNKTSETSSQDEESTATKVFPNRIEKNEVEETQSNASSTDDYVRELLDPDDRPRNVWHVVEGPKVQPEDENDGPSVDDGVQESSVDSPSGDQHNRDAEEPGSQVYEDRDDEVSMQNTENTNQSMEIRDEADKTEGVESGDGTDLAGSSKTDALDEHKHEKRCDDKKPGKTDEKRRGSHRDRSRDRSSRRHRHHDRDDSRGRDRDSHDRHRSRRRHDYSDDDDDDDDRRRSRHRDHRRSNSRSKTSSRRRERSRSESQSPITKRNSRTILIMQLNPRVHSRDLEEFFSDIGKVREVRLIMDTKTRRHKGIAYIEFDDASSVAKAFALNGQKFFGAPIVIQSAQTEKNRSSTDWHSSTSQIVNHASSHQTSRSHIPPNSYRVYVGGLNVNLTEEMIRSVFEPFGPIVRLELMRDRVTSVSRGYAFITYANIEDGQNAVQSLDGFELAGKSLRVSKSTDKSERHFGNPESSSGMNRGGNHHDGDSDSRSSRSKDLTASLYELAGH